MAVESLVTGIIQPGVAGSTLTAKKYFIVELNTDGKWDIADTDNGSELMHGVLRSNSSASNPTNTIVVNDPIDVLYFGVTKGEAGAAFDIGTTLTCDGSGRFVAGVTDGDFVLATALEVAGAVGDIVQVFFMGIPNQLAVA